MNANNWEDLYTQAATEVESKRVPERVSVAKHAIRNRLQVLAGSSDHHEERARLADTLELLNALQADAKKL